MPFPTNEELENAAASYDWLPPVGPTETDLGMKTDSLGRQYREVLVGSSVWDPEAYYRQDYIDDMDPNYDWSKNYENMELDPTVPFNMNDEFIPTEPADPLQFPDSSEFPLHGDYSNLTTTNDAWLLYEMKRKDFSAEQKVYQDLMNQIEIEYSGGIGVHESNWNPWPDDVRNHYNELADRKNKVWDSEELQKLNPTNLQRKGIDTNSDVHKTWMNRIKENILNPSKDNLTNVYQQHLLNNITKDEFKNIDYQKLGNTPIMSIPGAEIQLQNNPALSLISKFYNPTLNEYLGLGTKNTTEVSPGSGEYLPPGSIETASFSEGQGVSGEQTNQALRDKILQQLEADPGKKTVQQQIEEAVGTEFDYNLTSLGSKSEYGADYTGLGGQGDRFPNKIDQELESWLNKIANETNQNQLKVNKLVLETVKEAVENGNIDLEEEIPKVLGILQESLKRQAVDTEMEKYNKDPIGYAREQSLLASRFDKPKPAAPAHPITKTLQKVFGKDEGMTGFEPGFEPPDWKEVDQMITRDQKLTDLATGEGWQDRFVRETESERISRFQKLQDSLKDITAPIQNAWDRVQKIPTGSDPFDPSIKITLERRLNAANFPRSAWNISQAALPYLGSLLQQTGIKNFTEENPMNIPLSKSERKKYMEIANNWVNQLPPDRQEALLKGEPLTSKELGRYAVGNPDDGSLNYALAHQAYLDQTKLGVSPYYNTIHNLASEDAIQGLKRGPDGKLQIMGLGDNYRLTSRRDTSAGGRPASWLNELSHKIGDWTGAQSDTNNPNLQLEGYDPDEVGDIKGTGPIPARSAIDTPSHLDFSDLYDDYKENSMYRKPDGTLRSGVPPAPKPETSETPWMRPFTEGTDDWMANMPSWFSGWGGAEKFAGQAFPEEGVLGYNFSGALGRLTPAKSYGEPGMTNTGYGTIGYDRETNTGGTPWDFTPGTPSVHWNANSRSKRPDIPDSWPVPGFEVGVNDWDPISSAPQNNLIGNPFQSGGAEKFPLMRDRRHQGKKKINIPNPLSPSGRGVQDMSMNELMKGSGW